MTNHIASFVTNRSQKVFSTMRTIKAIVSGPDVRFLGFHLGRMSGFFHTSNLNFHEFGHFKAFTYSNIEYEFKAFWLYAQDGVWQYSLILILIWAKTIKTLKL
jgi:hypothetical protein